MFETTGYWRVDSNFGKILIAYLLTLPLGWLREKEAHQRGRPDLSDRGDGGCGYLLITKTGTAPTRLHGFCRD